MHPKMPRPPSFQQLRTAGLCAIFAPLAVGWNNASWGEGSSYEAGVGPKAIASHNIVASHVGGGGNRRCATLFMVAATVLQQRR